MSFQTECYLGTSKKWTYSEDVNWTFLISNIKEWFVDWCYREVSINLIPSSNFVALVNSFHFKYQKSDFHWAGTVCILSRNLFLEWSTEQQFIHNANVTSWGIWWQISKKVAYHHGCFKWSLHRSLVYEKTSCLR